MYKLILLIVALSAVMCSSAAAQIPDGFGIVQITNDPDHDAWARINNCGQIIFSKRINQSAALEEIFLYGNGRLSRLTENTIRDAFPDINDNGTVVWTQGADGFGGGTIVVYREGTATEIAKGFTPVINNQENIAWIVFTPGGCASPAGVYLYDGETTLEIVNDGFSNQSVQMNDSNELVWTHYDFCQSPWVSDIMLYSEETITSLAGRQSAPQIPDINNRAQVIRGGSGGLELWQNGASTLLTDWGRNPAINNHDGLYFIRWHEDTSTWQAWICIDCLTHSEKDPTFLQLTDDPFWNTDGDINDYAEVAWQAGDFPGSNIYFLRRIRDGDADFDADIDLDDFAMFGDCFTGPTPTDRLCDCRFLDLDHDRDVDWVDFGILQTNYTGAK